VDDFYAARSRTIPPLPWSNFAPPISVSCPSPENSIVVIGFGQSNSANHAGHRFRSESLDVVNFFNGKCYEAADPLLGATGRSGSVWIPFADRLHGLGKTVVLATIGVGGSRVESWIDPRDLKPYYIESIQSLRKTFPNPDYAIWIQGESEPPRVYRRVKLSQDTRYGSEDSSPEIYS